MDSECGGGERERARRRERERERERNRERYSEKLSTWQNDDYVDIDFDS